VKVRPVSQQTPTAVSLDHRSSAACVTLGFRTGRGGSFNGTCFSAATPADAGFQETASCTPEALAVLGLLPRGGRRAVGVLGDGTRRRAALIDLAPGLPGRRAFVLLVPGDRALRRLEVDGVASELGRAPTASACAEQGGPPERVSLGPSAAPPQAPAGPAAPLTTAPVALLEVDGHRLVAADGGDERLCLAVDRVDLRDDDCAPFGRGPGALLVRRGSDAGGGTVVAGVAAREQCGYDSSS